MPDCYTLAIVQGADLLVEFRWVDAAGNPKSLADYSPKSEVRTAPGGELLLDLTPHFAKEPDGRTGVLALDVPAGDTATVDKPGVWDLYLIGGAAPDVRLIGGDTTIELAVTDIA